MTATVVLVGCGNMGGALLAGWLARGLSPDSIVVVEPDDGHAAAAAARGVCVVAAADALASMPAPHVVVLAVKPQRLAEVLGGYAAFAGAGAVVLSIAAGRTIEALRSGLGDGTALVRAMPNTPASIGRGISVACANEHTTGAQKARCDELLAAVGSVLWVEDEALLDAVTAVSGSGPAYVFLLAECLARAGTQAGLPQAVAERLARETVAGAGELLARSPLSSMQLREAVTSPGGTTAAALSVLGGDAGLQPLLSAAVEAAVRRSRELAG